jgi:hypothetical protein
MTDTFENITTVLVERLPEARKELNKLVKKADRYGCTAVAYTVGQPYTQKRRHQDWDGIEREVTVDVVDLVITGEAPRVGNYEFLARIEHTEGGVLLSTKPGVEGLDERFRQASHACEHCRVARDRKELYVCRELGTGKQVQVGRTCLRDFLGMDNPASVAGRFNWFQELRSLGGYGEYSDGYQQSLVGLLSLASVAVRLFGWCSKGQAQMDEQLTATVEYVQVGLAAPGKLGQSDRALRLKLVEALTADDEALAARVIEWVRNAMPAKSDYEHNLKVIFAGDYVTDRRRLGLAVSAVAAHGRAVEAELRRTKEREGAKESAFVGTVGERFRGVLVTLQSSRTIQTNGYGDLVLNKFLDAQGNVLTWFTSGGVDLAIGEQALLDGTVKDHKEYQGAKETQLTRCKIKEVR